MWGEWERSEKLEFLGMALLTLLIESCGLVEAQQVRNGVKDVAYYLQPTEELKEWISGFKSDMELLRPQFMPCVVPPRPWTTPFDGGYHSPRANVRRSLVKRCSKGYLKELAHKSMPDVYEAINALQETRWKINGAMLTIVREIWEAGLEVKGLPSRNDTPLPGKPADIDSNPKALAAWKRAAGDVYRSNVRAGSKRIQAAKIRLVADKFAYYAAIWFPMQLDFRGRCMPSRCFSTRRATISPRCF